MNTKFYTIQFLSTSREPLPRGMLHVIAILLTMIWSDHLAASFATPSLGIFFFLYYYYSPSSSSTSSSSYSSFFLTSRSLSACSDFIQAIFFLRLPSSKNVFLGYRTSLLTFPYCPLYSGYINGIRLFQIEFIYVYYKYLCTFDINTVWSVFFKGHIGCLNFR